MMHVAKYLGQAKREKSPMLTVGGYYQIEYSYTDKQMMSMVDVLIHPIFKSSDEWWEGHIEYETIQDAFDDWDDTCKEVRNLEPFKAKKAMFTGQGGDDGGSEGPAD